MPSVVPKKGKATRKKTPTRDDEDEAQQNPEVRRAFEYLSKEADKVQERGGRVKEGTNTARAVGVLLDMRVSFEMLLKQKAALSTLALLLQPGVTDELQTSVVRLFASAAEHGPAATEKAGERDRLHSKADAELQNFLGVSCKAIANVITIAENASGSGLQVDAFTLVVELIRDNEATQAEAVRCNLVALLDRKMAAGEDPVGQIAAAGCASLIVTEQGLGLMVNSHSMDIMCGMLRSHAGRVKMAAVRAIAKLAMRPELHAELERLLVFESLVCLMFEPSQRLVAAVLGAIMSFLKLGGKTEEHASRLRTYAASAVNNNLVQGVLDLGIHGVQSDELCLACIEFITMSIKLLVPDVPKVLESAPKTEKKKEDVLDRKSRRGLNSLTAHGAHDKTAAQDATSKHDPQPVQHAQATSSKPLITQLLSCKHRFVEWIVCMLSTNSARVHKATMEIMTLTMDRKKELATAFAVPSVCWALTSVCAREDRDEGMREVALRKLVDLVRSTTGIGAPLKNKIVAELAERYNVKYNPPTSWVEQVANANKTSLELDLKNALKLLVNNKVDTVVQTEVLIWIRCMARAENKARSLLADSGTYIETLLTIIQGDLTAYPLVFRCRCLEVFNELLHSPARCSWASLHPIKCFRTHHSYALPVQTFAYFAQYLLKVWCDERKSKAEQEALDAAAAEEAVPEQQKQSKTLPRLAERQSAAKQEAADVVTHDLLLELGYSLIGMMRENITMQVTAARMGICEKAMDMLTDNSSQAMRRLGADILSAVCEGAPSLSRLVLSIGQAQEFVKRATFRTHDESFPPVLGAIFGILAELEPAPPPQLDTDGLEKLTDVVRKKKVADFEKFAAQAHTEELRRISDLEPLVVSSLHLLLTLCGTKHGFDGPGALGMRWKELRMPLRFIQWNVRFRCWLERSIFDIMLNLVAHSKPHVAHTALRVVSALCEIPTEHHENMPSDYVPEDERITDSAFILSMLRQLDGNAADSGCPTTVVSSVHGEGLSALAGLLAKVPYAGYLEKVAQRLGLLLRDALIAQEALTCVHLLASFQNLARCHPAIRAPFYDNQGLQALGSCLNIEGGELSLCAARILQMLSNADSLANYGMEIKMDLTDHYGKDWVVVAIKILVQLVQSTKEAGQLVHYVAALGAMGRNRMLSTIVDSENGIFVLVRLLASTEAGVVAAAGMALADMCKDAFASEARFKIKMLGALPCAFSLMSSPDHLVQESMCVLAVAAAQDAKIRPTLGKLDAVAHVIRLMDCSSCREVQSAAMLSLVELVRSATSARRFAMLGGPDTLYRALRSNDGKIMSAAATAVGAISSRVDTDTTTIFADIRQAFVANSCYAFFLDVIEKQRQRADAVAIACMRAFEAFCHRRSSLETEFISAAIKTIKARAEDPSSSHQVRLCAVTVCSLLSQYSSSVGKDLRKWLVTSIQGNLASPNVIDKTSACRAMRGLWWDKICKDSICKRAEDLEQVYGMLKDQRSRPAAAGALEGLIAADHHFAAEVAARGCTEHIYLLLRSAVAQEAEQAAKTLAVMCSQPASLASVLAEIPRQKKKEGISPIITVMDLHENPDLKIACANCIREVARLPKWTVKIAEESTAGLVRMLQSTDQEVVLAAADVLQAMANFQSTHQVLRREGAVLTLNALLTDSSEKVRTAGCATLELLSQDQQCNDIMVRVGAAKTLLTIMRKDTFSMICRSGEAIRAMVKLPSAQVEFLALDGMDVLHLLLESQSTDVRKITGTILEKLLRNPRNKAGFKDSKLFFKCMQLLTNDPDMDVRRTLCEALCMFAGNDAVVNIEFKTALYEAGYVRALDALLQDPRADPLGIKTRSVAATSLSNMCSIAAVQNDIQSMELLDVLVPLLESNTARQAVAVANAITRAVRYHVPNRQSAHRAGLVDKLAAGLKWNGESRGLVTKAKANVMAQQKELVKVRSAAAEALSALLECPNCRRTYQGTRAVETTIQGSVLQVPSIIIVCDCPHREVCLACAEGAAQCNIVDVVLDMLKAPEAGLRNSGARLLGSLAIGAPYHGRCKLSDSVCQKVLDHGALDSIFKMLTAKDAFDSGRAAAEQFAAARAVDSIATRDNMRYACCKAGFIKALVDMLFSTLGRVKGSAALALSRLCATDHLHFYFNTQTEKTYWDRPDDLIFAMKPNGTPEYFAPEDVERDTMRKGFWVRGIFKPLELVPYCDMLINSAPIKHGHGSGMHKMKADASIVTTQPILDLILDIFKSPIYDKEVNGWAAESCAIVSEFYGNRQRIALSGCVPDIVALLYSSHSVWKEQAAIGLGILMYDEQARDIAGSVGVVDGITEILLSPYSTQSLKESAALAMAKACWNAANQVLGLQSGAIMPLIAMLTQSDIRQWCCAVEALMAMSNNHACRSAIGHAGAIPALVNKLTLDGVEGETVAQVRVLATLINVLSIPDNCDMAVNCGVLMRFIYMTKAQDLLLLQYLMIAMVTVLRCERWRKRFVESGIVQAILGLVERYSFDTEAGRHPGAALVRVNAGKMLRDLSDGELFKTTMVHLGAFPALRVLAESPEAETQACVAASIANLAFTDEFKKQARLDGLIPAVCRLMRKRSLEVQLEAASAVRVLGSSHENKEALVEHGALHGLRDMLDHNSVEARVRATGAMSLLATNQDNGAALSKAGAVRPLVDLLDTTDPNVMAGSARTLAEVTRTSKIDTRAELAAWGAIPKLSAAFESTDPRVTLQITRTIENLTKHEGLSSKAANAAKSFMLMEQRTGQVVADTTAHLNRQKMAGAGIAAKLKPVIDSCPDPATVVHARNSLAQIQGQHDMAPF